MKMTSTVEYINNLRTEATHSKSGKTIITDAPPDNNGKGEAFSPTDLTATSLASCVMTIMGIKANASGILFERATANVEKIMASNPRRIAQINIEISVEGNFSEAEKNTLERAGLACPVAKSLHPDIFQNITFVWT